MAHADRYGLPLSTDSAAAADAYVEGLELLLRNGDGARSRFAHALELDPEFALARATLAAQWQFEPDPLVPIGQIMLAARHAEHASRRERQFIDALKCSIVGEAPAAIRLIRGHLESFPLDALMVRQRAILRGYSGGARRKSQSAAELGELAPHYGEDPWFLGIYSLALSETGQAGEATRLAHAGLAAQPDSGVLAHSLAHTHFESGDDAAGQEFLHSWLTEYGDGSANAGHLTWHLALTHVARSEPARAFDLFTARNGAAGPGGLRLEDASALLWRLHLRGFDLRREWESVLRAEPSAGPDRAFVLAHVAFALTAIGDSDGVRRLASHVIEDAARRPHEPFRFLVPLLDALELVARGRWGEAAPALEKAAINARRLGGSNEQHTVFDETAVAAYLRSGRTADAQRLGEQRLRGRSIGVLVG